VLEETCKKDFKTEYKNSYVDLISKIVEELLIEGKLNKLQTFGYQLEKTGGPVPSGGGYNAMNMPPMMGNAGGYSVKCNYINLNKQCMITKNWERVYLMLGDAVFWHVYKDYMIFLKTRDESLVQISGTNIFFYLNDRLGKLQSAFYEGGAQQPEEGAGPPKKNHQKSHKYNLKLETDSYLAVQKAQTFQDEQINRNRLFYSSHMNRKTHFFQKHILNDKKLPA
jgi:hypothetical protein